MYGLRFTPPSPRRPGGPPRDHLGEEPRLAGKLASRRLDVFRRDWSRWRRWPGGGTSRRGLEDEDGRAGRVLVMGGASARAGIQADRAGGAGSCNRTSGGFLKLGGGLVWRRTGRTARASIGHEAAVLVDVRVPHGVLQNSSTGVNAKAARGRRDGRLDLA